MCVMFMVVCLWCLLVCVLGGLVSLLVFTLCVVFLPGFFAGSMFSWFLVSTWCAGFSLCILFIIWSHVVCFSHRCSLMYSMSSFWMFFVCAGVYCVSCLFPYASLVYVFLGSWFYLGFLPSCIPCILVMSVSCVPISVWFSRVLGFLVFLGF